MQNDEVSTGLSPQFSATDAVMDQSTPAVSSPNALPADALQVTPAELSAVSQALNAQAAQQTATGSMAFPSHADGSLLSNAVPSQLSPSATAPGIPAEQTAGTVDQTATVSAHVGMGNTNQSDSTFTAPHMHPTLPSETPAADPFTSVSTPVTSLELSTNPATAAEKSLPGIPLTVLGVTGAADPFFGEPSALKTPPEPAPASVAIAEPLGNHMDPCGVQVHAPFLAQIISVVSPNLPLELGFSPPSLLKSPPSSPDAAASSGHAAGTPLKLTAPVQLGASTDAGLLETLPAFQQLTPCAGLPHGPGSVSFSTGLSQEAVPGSSSAPAIAQLFFRQSSAQLSQRS
eukprot:RCo011489